MYLINNKLTVDLAPYVDVKSLLELKPYLDYAVVKSSDMASAARYFGHQFLEKDLTGITDYLNPYTEFDLSKYPFLEELKATDKLANWIRYQYDVTYGQQSIPIIYPTSWKTKHQSLSCVKTKNAEYFNVLFDWVEKQNIFSDYGRVVVFVNEPKTETPTHFDGYSNNESDRDQFIWINLDLRKKFFILDVEKNVKHYLDTVIGTFDNYNYHGAEPSNFATWSLRIDGTFSKEFLEKTGLGSHFITSV